MDPCSNKLDNARFYVNVGTDHYAEFVFGIQIGQKPFIYVRMGCQKCHLPIIRRPSHFCNSSMDCFVNAPDQQWSRSRDSVELQQPAWAISRARRCVLRRISCALPLPAGPTRKPIRLALHACLSLQAILQLFTQHPTSKSGNFIEAGALSYVACAPSSATPATYN